MKVAIVGSRSFYEHQEFMEQYVKNYVTSLPSSLEIVSGESPGGGVDTWVREATNDCGKKFHPFPPKRKTRRDYFARNTKIAEFADVVVAFQREYSSGTADTIRKAIDLGKTVVIYRLQGNLLTRYVENPGE